ncbi:hypothetical protein ACC724_38155, partial [Rhizobium ruizarguesonis]
AAGAEVCAIAYDLNLPEVVTRLEALWPKLKIIIDDSASTMPSPRWMVSAKSEAEFLPVTRKSVSMTASPGNPAKSSMVP